MPIKYGKPFKVKKGTTLYKRMKHDRATARRRAAVRRRRAFVNPRSRLSGYAKMPYFKYSRAYDGPVLDLKVSNHVTDGLWTYEIKTDFNNIPGASVFKEMYRFFRIKKMLIQYTPAMRSDEYSKLFAFPMSGAQQLFNAGGAVLEIKHLKSYGYEGTPTTWEGTMNRAGKLRKCASTKPFRKLVRPTLQVVIADTVGTDPTKISSAPWLSTEVTDNLSLDHYCGIDCWHSMNNVSYDNAYPLQIHQRFVVEVEFKGLKI